MTLLLDAIVQYLHACEKYLQIFLVDLTPLPGVLMAECIRNRHLPGVNPMQFGTWLVSGKITARSLLEAEGN